MLLFKFLPFLILYCTQQCTQGDLLQPTECAKAPRRLACPNRQKLFAGPLKECVLFATLIYTWDQCNTFCRSWGGNLISIHTEEQNKFISNKFNEFEKNGRLMRETWLGLREVRIRKDYSWSDNSVYDYESFDNLEPQGRGLCVAFTIKEGGMSWADRECSKEGNCLCTKTPFSLAKTTISLHRRFCKCDSCYVMVDEAKKFSEAEGVCVSLGGHLTNVQSYDESNMLADKVVQSTVDNNPSRLIGLNNLEDRSVWRWIDGSPSKYFNWAPSEPNNDNENCVIIAHEKSKDWHDTSCSMPYPFICGTRQNPRTKSNYCWMD